MERFNSVFSDYLTQIGVREVNKPADIYTALRNAYNQGATYILYNAELLTQKDENKRYDLMYKCCINKDLKNIISWINKKIILKLDIHDYRTIGVRLRIATGMLNKLVHEGKLSRDVGIKVHDTLVFNLNREISAINTQDLPF